MTLAQLIKLKDKAVKEQDFELAVILRAEQWDMERLLKLRNKKLKRILK